MAPAVNLLRNSRFDNMLPTDLRDKYPLRTSALRLLQATDQEHHVNYWVNMASKHDTQVDLPQMETFKASDSNCNINIYRYYDKDLGHNPLPHEKTLSIINESFTNQ